MQTWADAKTYQWETALIGLSLMCYYVDTTAIYGLRREQLINSGKQLNTNVSGIQCLSDEVFIEDIQTDWEANQRSFA